MRPLVAGVGGRARQPGGSGGAWGAGAPGRGGRV